MITITHYGLATVKQCYKKRIQRHNYSTFCLEITQMYAFTKIFSLKSLTNVDVTSTVVKGLKCMALLELLLKICGVYGSQTKRFPTAALNTTE